MLKDHPSLNRAPAVYRRAGVCASARRPGARLGAENRDGPARHLRYIIVGGAGDSLARERARIDAGERLTMRWFVWPVAVLLCVAVIPEEPDGVSSEAARLPASEYPLWKPGESIEGYAKRAGLPPADHLDLGNGVRVELVLVPAGDFIMGAAPPEAVKEEAWSGVLMLSLGLLGLVILFFPVAARAQVKRRLQYSLGRFVLMIIALGVATMGGTQLWLARAEQERFQAELARYNASNVAEKPAHLVRILQPFYMSRSEITEGQFHKALGFIRDSGSEDISLQVNPAPLLPVRYVSWKDAQVFCGRLRELDARRQRTVRLPFEAEWEFACRAGATGNYSPGDSPTELSKAGWHAGNSGNTVRPVGLKLPNAFGLYDLHGNLWEWCEDSFLSYTEAPAAAPPKVRVWSGRSRVIRGGCFVAGPEYARCSSRLGQDPALRSDRIGIRIVVEVQKEKDK
jgi:formylglycine-generating enzyme required for sulfatase activity